MTIPRKVLGDYTDRELRVIEMRASGIRLRDIATREGVSRDTIYQIVTRLYRKSGTANREELTEWAWFAGLDVPGPAGDADAPAPGPALPVRQTG